MTFASGTALSAIEGARRADLADIRWLLSLEGLPTADITEHSLEHFLIYRDVIEIAGVVGLNAFGDVALLRSLVVADVRLRRGLGKRLVAAAEDLALDSAFVRSIYSPRRRSCISKHWDFVM